MAKTSENENNENRDHKKLGPKLDLFTFSDLVGPGLPLWTPKGTILRNLLDEFVWQLRKTRGYERVEIPHITKKELYEKSGHWEKFKDELFQIKTREGHIFAVKPMNCPHHTQIYARKPWSYRELPQRYANTTMCYRDEQSGELGGLSRVRAFTQDDAHAFCRMSQVKEEFLKIWDIIHEFYGAFGFDLQVRFSRHDPKQPEKYLGDKERWTTAENILGEIIKEKKVKAIDGIGEAAFYGPKLDFMAKDSLGREWQVATIQLDLNMPDRFDLTCVNENGEAERIAMIHAAIMGSIERFLSVLIEHTGGAFPLWLSPVQAAVLPLSEKYKTYAQKIFEELKEKNIRVQMTDADEPLGKRIRESEIQKIPYVIVVGEKEEKSENVSVRRRGSAFAKATADKQDGLPSEASAKEGEISMENLLEKIEREVNEKII
ncbi:MAG TPA: threonine--tRNA ligase [Candidatus Paceibacterota bacterium]|nr:threonine--tRNA ligase [Candidatus Paceibacterota bacterium]